MTWATLSTDAELKFYPGVPEYKQLSEAVGGWIEAVTASLGGQNVTIYLNEEGKLERLPPNYAATDLTNGTLGWDVIVGNVVLVGGPDREGRDTSLLDNTVVWLNRRFARRGDDESPTEFLFRLAAVPMAMAPLPPEEKE